LITAATDADAHKTDTAAALAAAKDADSAADLHVAETHAAVVFALQTAGKPFVDTHAEPPVLYTPKADGSDFDATPIGSLDDDL
jgi:hypothetical protein